MKKIQCVALPRSRYCTGQDFAAVRLRGEDRSACRFARDDRYTDIANEFALTQTREGGRSKTCPTSISIGAGRGHGSRDLDRYTVGGGARGWCPGPDSNRHFLSEIR